MIVNKLVRVAGWYTRVKYVDDLSVLECIPRCSPSYMPCIANEIAQYASDHGMRLNAKKCKEIIFSFLQYQPFPATPLCLSGRVIERVGHYKLLGVFISSDLSWIKYCEYVLAKANKRLYAFNLRVLRKCGVACQDLVQVYCRLVRSVIEYAAPVWADLRIYLSKTLELIQKRAFNIIFPGLPYNVALSRSGLLPLSQRRKKSCQKLKQNFRDKGFL